MSDIARASFAKADRALRSARLLLQNGDVDGACSRAYYAIFDAAKGALSSLDPAVDRSDVKTHRGIMGAFDARLVRTDTVPRELGRLFRHAQELRLVGDYRTDSVGEEDAATAVEEAERFVAAMVALVGGDVEDDTSPPG